MLVSEDPQKCALYAHLPCCIQSMQARYYWIIEFLGTYAWIFACLLGCFFGAENKPYIITAWAAMSCLVVA